MNLTLSIDDETLRRARKQAEAMGSSVNQLVREYLDKLSGKWSGEQAAEEFASISKTVRGDSQGWRFNRDELHDRR